MAPAALYRVEHSSGAEQRILGYLDHGPAHFRTLDVFVGRLLLEGHGGTLLLIHQPSRQVVARRSLVPARG